VARFADGWMPLGDPTEPMVRLRQFLTEAGRDPATFSLTGRVAAGPEGADTWIKEAQRLQAVGVTDLIIGAPPDLSPSQGAARVIEVKNAIAGALG
jgi:alkanesulfonate monooxygenase SsuD/methylene tetrahydromethanopterin reductase-like flavin-dependent oxidoreductase (luciferase family)